MKVASIALVFVGALAAFAAAPAQAQNITDTDILVFALNLEYLEAQFYQYAVYGRGIPAALTGGGPATVGGQKANLTGATLAYATEIANDELKHVEFLRAALGDDAVPMPAMDIGPAFVAAANAAFNMTLDPPFNPYANDLFFLHGAFIFEDVGVTAYKGAAALIQNKDFLTAAAGILSVEAYHAGLVRRSLYVQSNTTVEAYGAPVSAIVDAIAALRASAANATDDQGVVLNGTANLVPTDENSITFSRTPQQVLSIVSLGAAGNMGGFFPDGLNGNIA